MMFRRVSRLIILITVFNLDRSVGSATNQTSPHRAVMDAEGDFVIYWRFDGERIEFEAEVHTLGYIGFGVSRKGEMKGADIIIGGVNDEGHVYFSDRHGTGHSEPVSDNCQDWYVISGQENATHTKLRFGRPLETCDPQDFSIKSETVRLIWSIGREDPNSDGQATYHVKRGTTSVFLLSQQGVVHSVLPTDSVHVDFRNQQVELSAEDTTYWCQAFALPVMSKHHIVKFEPIIQPGHESLVHHIIIYGCFNESRVSSVGTGHLCYNDNMPEEWWECNAVMFAWAIGGGPFYFPDHVGYPMGFDGDPSILLMETHYDNQQRKRGLVDSSGLRMTLTPRLREFDAGIISVGSLVWKTQVIPPHVPNFKTEGHCHSECLTQALENRQSGLNVIGGILHAHLLGIAMRVRHFRNGTELPNILQDDNYDFNLQETRLVKDEVTILPGDHLATECVYDSTRRSLVTFGGQSTSEEMCLGYIIYYPRIELTNCESTPHPRTLVEFALGHARIPPGEVSTTRFSWVRAFLRHIDWTNSETRRNFQNISTAPDRPVMVRCQQGPVQYKVQGETVRLPPVLEPLEEMETPCGEVALGRNGGGDTRPTYLHPVVGDVVAVVHIHGPYSNSSHHGSENGGIRTDSNKAIRNGEIGNIVFLLQSLLAVLLVFCL